MGYSRGSDGFDVDAPPPTSSGLAWLAVGLALLTTGLCIGWALVVVVW